MYLYIFEGFYAFQVETLPVNDNDGKVLTLTAVKFSLFEYICYRSMAIINILIL